MSAPFRFPKFFVTNPSPCPYLPGKVERKVFTELNGRQAGELNEALGRIGFRRSQSVAYRPSCIDCSSCVSVRVLAAEFQATATQRKLIRRHSNELNEALGRIGFRRSQSVAYRPSCIDCSACVSVRVAAAEFEPNATQRKIARRHSDLEVSARKPWTTDEQYALLRKYLAARHPGGGMTEMDENDFADMVEQSPVRTYLVEYREPSLDGRPGRLVGACLSDQQGDGMSMIYSFYDVGEGSRRGLGTYIILDHINRAAHRRRRRRSCRSSTCHRPAGH